jgi:hypothetical protein
MKSLVKLVKQAYHDEQGAEGLEKILILAAIVLPLLAVLIYFRNEIKEYVFGKAEDVMSDANDFDPEGPDF